VSRYVMLRLPDFWPYCTENALVLLWMQQFRPSTAGDRRGKNTCSTKTLTVLDPAWHMTFD
jgi:hypothetical protein